MAVGLDVGTGNIVSARKNKNGKINIKRERNAFIYIGKWDAVKTKLSRTSIPYTNIDGKVYIIGTAAFDYANVFGDVTLRRPMALGTLNPSEKEALPIIRELIKSLLGEPTTENEICVYVIPSDPIDVAGHIVYHEDVIKMIVESLGYKAVGIQESIALAYTGLIDDNLTGIAISLGSGMANSCVMYQGLTALSFSITKSGDYIDQNASKETNTPLSHITSIKENSSFSLLTEHKSREEMAVNSYYRFVIANILSNISNIFNTSKGMPYFKTPVNIVCGGGTSMVPGFSTVFLEEYSKLEFPIPVNSIKVIEDPLFAVAKGALSEAILKEDEITTEDIK